MSFFFFFQSHLSVHSSCCKGLHDLNELNRLAVPVRTTLKHL